MTTNRIRVVRVELMETYLVTVSAGVAAFNATPAEARQLADDLYAATGGKSGDIVTPCHRAKVYVTTRSEGLAYMQSDVPDEILCSAPACYNSWDANGVADEWNTPKGVNL